MKSRCACVWFAGTDTSVIVAAGGSRRSSTAASRRFLHAELRDLHSKGDRQREGVTVS